jgi:integrase
LAAFAKDLASAGAGKAFPVTERLLQVLALTAARNREIRLMKWSEIVGLDGEVAAVANIPVERMKKRTAWSIPLSAQVVGLLLEVRGWQAGFQGLKGVRDGFVFTRLEGSYKGRLCSENAVNDLLSVMGWGDELVGHGLRKVFSTVAYDCWPFAAANRTEAIEFSLAHVHKDKVRGTYDLNDYGVQRRALMDWWAGHLDLLAQPQAESRKVVPLRAA